MWLQADNGYVNLDTGVFLSHSSLIVDGLPTSDQGVYLGAHYLGINYATGALALDAIRRLVSGVHASDLL